MQDDSMIVIFTTILANFLEKFSSECRALADRMVSASVSMYNTILADLRPTPAKSHYTYNLRDLSKVFQVNCSVLDHVRPKARCTHTTVRCGHRFRIMC